MALANIIKEVDPPVELTQAEYDALSTAQKNDGTVYFITDGNGAFPIAATVPAEDTSGGTSNVQDELQKKVEKADVVNNFTTTQEGYVADARALKTIADNYLLKTDLQVQVLWNGSPMLMTDSQTATLSKNISTMNHGIILHWQEWRDGAVKSASHMYSYIPKYQIEYFAGQGVSMPLNGVDGTIGYKYCYIHNNKIVGNAKNSQNVTKNGVTYNNGLWVLTTVLGI